jgi:hypothetical protein
MITSGRDWLYLVINLNRGFKMENNFQLDVDQVAVFEGIGTNFAMAEVDADAALEDFARAVTVEVVDQETGETSQQSDYDTWETGMEVVKAAYAKKKKVSLDSDTVKGMVKRFYARLEEKYNLTKPKSGNKDSQAKAERRAKAAAEKAVQMEKTFEQLQAEVAMLTANATKANLAKAAKVAAVIEDKRALVLKDRMDSIKALQAEVVAAAKSCLEEDKLNAALAVLNDFDYQVAGL